MEKKMMASKGILTTKKTFLLIVLVGSLSALSLPSFSAFGQPQSIEILGQTIDYEIENGEILGVDLDIDFVELIIDFVTVDDGVLEITIPRALLDSKLSETEDDIFFILVDGFETEYLEIYSTAESRALLIPFFGGDSQLEIIGTDVLDEELGLTEEPSIDIPAWIKNNAGWWADGMIGDSDFVSGIQYLIQEGIMSIPETESGSGSTGKEIPAWIKNNAGWWADGMIGDSDFVSGIQYLITNDIMVI